MLGTISAGHGSDIDLIFASNACVTGLAIWPRISRIALTAAPIDASSRGLRKGWAIRARLGPRTGFERPSIAALAGTTVGPGIPRNTSAVRRCVAAGRGFRAGRAVDTRATAAADLVFPRHAAHAWAAVRAGVPHIALAVRRGIAGSDRPRMSGAVLATGLGYRSRRIRVFGGDAVCGAEGFRIVWSCFSTPRIAIRLPLRQEMLDKRCPNISTSKQASQVSGACPQRHALAHPCKQHLLRKL